MKIAFIIHPLQEVALPFDADGSTPNLTYQNARRLVEAGHEVIIYAKKNRGARPIEYDQTGIGIRRLTYIGEDWLLKPFDLLERVFTLGSRKRPFFASSLYFLGFALQVAFDLKSQRCDAVHIHNFSQFVPVIRAVNPGIKIILHMHCEWLALLDEKMIERRLRQVDLVVGCSHHITEGVQRRFPHLDVPCETVYNGVDVDHFAEKPDSRNHPAKRILYVGRVSPEKGVHVLLDAFRIIAAEDPDVRLDIVGPSRLLAYPFLVGLSQEDPVVADLERFYGQSFVEKVEKILFTRNSSYLDDLRSRVSEAQAQRVTIHGAVPHSALHRFYQRADLVVLPSVCNEAFGMSLIEAMACGKPVVAARAGGMPEVVVPGKTGLLVERDHAPALAEAILYLLEDDALCQAMGEAGRRRVIQHFSWERVTDALLNAYQHMDPVPPPIRSELTPV